MTAGINTNPNLKTFADLYKEGYQPQISALQSQNNISAQSPKLNNSLEQDTVTINGQQKGKNKKKTLAILGAAVGVVAAGVLAAFLINKNRKGATKAVQEVANEVIEKTPLNNEKATKAVQEVANEAVEVVQNSLNNEKIVQNIKGAVSKQAPDVSEEIQQKIGENLTQEINTFIDTAKGCANKAQNEAKEVLDKANKDKETVTKLFKEGAKTTSDGKPIVTIKYNIMEEFAEDGTTVLRKSSFGEKGNLSEITEFSKDGKKNVLSFYDEKLSSYKEGLENLPDKTKFAKMITFKNDDSLSLYEEGFEINGKIMALSTSTDKVISFDNGKISYYSEGSKQLPSGGFVNDKIIDFVDGQPFEYVKNSSNKGSDVRVSLVDDCNCKTELSQTYIDELLLYSEFL